MVRLRDINNVEIAVLENAYNVGYSLSSKELWTAHFSLPNDDPKLPLVTPYHYVEIEDTDGEYIGLFRILPSKTEANGTVGTTTYTCYHVFHTLTDSAYFGELLKIDETASDVIEAILAAQKVQNWVFGYSEASELVSLYLNHSNGLVEPMYNLLENMTGDYVYSFNTRVYPWVVSLIRTPDTPVCRIKEGYNMHGFDILSEPSNAINRVYPICFDDEQNQITIESVNSGKLYLEDAALVAAHGPIEYIYEHDDWVDPTVLKEIGQTVLDSAKKIKVTWNCSASDLVKLVEEPLFVIDRLRVNTLVRVETSDFGDLNMLIRKVTKRDMYGSPEDLELELDAGNAVPTFDMPHLQRQITLTNRRITSTAKSVLTKGREIATDLINSGHGGHVRVYPNYMLIMDTDDESTATNVWQYNLHGIGHSSTGVLGPYIYAWTIDGAFNTDFIMANSITANHLASDVGQSLNLSSNEAIVSKVSQGELESAVSGLASESYVDSAIDSINRANPNLVSNRYDKWEQGDIVNGVETESLKHIRTQSYYPIRAGAVTIKINPLYEVALVFYNNNYGYVSTTTFSVSQTVSLPDNRYFRAIVKRVGTENIVPRDIDTAELKVENAAEATQWTPYYGDMTLDEQRDLFVLDVTSTNGWTVDTNEWTTQLQANLYLFNEDVTSRYLGSSITWFRQYPGEEKAIIGSGQIFNVTPSMTDKSATYEVVFNLPANNYYIMTKTGDRILTKGGDLILARVSNDPGISISASKVLVRDYRDKIISAESSITQLATSITQKVEQSSYNADKNVIENSITTLTTKVGSVEASVNGATHTFTQTGYEFRDSKGDVIFSTTKGMANEQNLMKYDDCENGYPLIIPIHIGASTASIEQVLIKWRNSPFRATAKSAASGGGTKTSASGGGTKTSASGGGTTSGASSASTTASGGSASVTSASGGGHTSGSGGGGSVTSSSIVSPSYATTYTGDTGGHFHSYTQLSTHYHRMDLPWHAHAVYNHTHTVSIPSHSHSMPHTHSNPNHTHTISLDHTHTIDLNHSHNLVFGVVEQAISSNASTIWVDGVQRGSVSASQGELDVTPYLQTTGWHTVELRTTTLKRIDANIFVKSYIRR